MAWCCGEAESGWEEAGQSGFSGSRYEEGGLVPHLRIHNLFQQLLGRSVTLYHYSPSFTNGLQCQRTVTSPATYIYDSSGGISEMGKAYQAA